MEISHIKLEKFSENNRAEFQLVGTCIQKFCEEKKFPLILFLKFPLWKIKQAFYIAEKKNIKSSKYIYAICRNLK